MKKDRVVRVRYWQWIIFLMLTQFIDQFEMRIFFASILIGLLIWSERHNRKYYKNIRRLVIQDELTGLYNYRYMLCRLEEEVAKAKRYETPLLLLMIDVDKFKPFNDSYGHGAGNRALQKISLILREYTRTGDILARFGGDEFICICPNTTLDKGNIVAERLRKKIEETIFVSGPRELTVSIGLKEYRKDESLEEFFVKADEKLYKSKLNGRNQVYVA